MMRMTYRCDGNGSGNGARGVAMMFVAYTSNNFMIKSFAMVLPNITMNNQPCT
jgi:hypothetical protein